MQCTTCGKDNLNEQNCWIRRNEEGVIEEVLCDPCFNKMHDAFMQENPENKYHVTKGQNLS